jgi:hypothetical protein
MVRILFIHLCLISFAVTVGCQRQPPLEFAAVEGTVTKGGKPLSGVVVVFWADPADGTVGPASSGATDAAGHYELHTDQGDDGAVVGRYRVCIIDSKILLSRMLSGTADRDRLPKELPAATGPVVVPPAYADQKETPLRAEVRPGPQVINLEVK